MNKNEREESSRPDRGLSFRERRNASSGGDAVMEVALVMAILGLLAALPTVMKSEVAGAEKYAASVATGNSVNPTAK